MKSIKNYREMKGKITQRLSHISRSWGFKEGHGKIFGSLLLRQQPTPMKEISKDTGYSISAVSMHLDLLQRLGLVSKVKKGRTFLFAAERDFVQFYKERLSDILRKELSPLEKEINTEIKELEKTRDEEGKILLKAMRKTKESVKKAREYIKSLLEINSHST